MFWSYVYNLPTGATASYWQLVSLYVSVGNGQTIAKVRGLLMRRLSWMERLRC